MFCAGKGTGFNLNIPLPPGTTGSEFLKALCECALPKIQTFDPDILLISLGTDTARADPEVSKNKLSDSNTKMKLKNLRILLYFLYPITPPVYLDISSFHLIYNYDVDYNNCCHCEVTQT